MRKAQCVLLWSSVLFSVLSNAQQNAVHIQGSDTLILLGQNVNKLYQRTKPGISIRVHGGGLQSAIPLLLKGEIQIAQGRGELPAESNGELLTVPIGVEGVVVYVNESNWLNELSIAQLRSIYLGEITNWKQLGGPDKRINLYAGESNAGVIAYFQEYVLHGAESFGFWGKNSTKELLDVIAQDPYGLGFASSGSAPHAKALRIRVAAGSPAIEPSIANIRSRRYPISRYIYWYFARKPQGVVKDFCEWAFSSQGQLVIESIGFEPLVPEDRSAAMRKLGIGN